ncbi:MAG TPA: Asp23/Gls24 family envelope stress response protein [Bacillota bacterium]|nr:MAG: Alkaline shock protein 23 [Firmicutes bacterium ADurb.Bin153]HQJ24458.1 Asp23/Gls24 family envelope stress response protein [Bacillota bacterium]
MARELSTELGQITISDDVIAAIAGMAAHESYGLVGMASRTFTDGIAELLGLENISKGVEVKIDGEHVRINLFVIVEYGTRVTEVAKNVIDKVKYVVEAMTGLNVAEVKITVQGVRVGNGGKEKR